ncbi:MAG: 30S ribosomal protein S20 [Pseudobutyrivibrio sp.]|uniref:30S ribosomal protein S20 n=1 Tax=Pseudobutyrivibrio sp. TaxID=2014367 RepID=UPI0025D79F9A|nr:30S ribosomal protein S20 [Pseudobutyrivibrio sp.]MBQ8488153.1 30S ribosomal protein S20 [Pseudobutyrivibrio sp.]
MANIKSAKKRVQVTAVRTERNKAIKSEVKTYVKRVEAAVESGDKAVAESELKAAIKVIEMAGSKGVYHDNTVSRKVSRLTKLVNKLA